MVRFHEKPEVERRNCGIHFIKGMKLEAGCEIVMQTCKESKKHFTSWTRMVFGTSLLFAASGGVMAQGSEDLSESLFFSDLPPVLTATRLSQPRKDIPASITIIDREMIEASGAVEVADLLKLVPGFQVGRVTNSKYTVTYHGNSDAFARDLQVLIDGRSVYDPTFGGVSWKDLPLSLEEIDHIEVIRGPNAAAYGSNAFAAIVNIISRWPAERQGVQSSVLIGSEVSRRATLSYSERKGDFSCRVSTQFDENDGFDTRSDASRTRWLRFLGDYDFDNSNRLSLDIGVSNADIGRGFPGDPIQPIRTEGHNANYQRLNWTHFNNPGDEFRITAFHNRLVIGDDFFVLPAIHTGYGFVSDRYDLELQRNLALGESVRLVTGLGTRLDQSRGYWIYDRNDTLSRNQIRAFFNLERQWKSTTLNLGAMYEKFQGKSGLFSPRIGANYHLDSRNTLRFSASRAYRMPSLFEDYANLGAKLGTLTVLQWILSNQRLDPERITAYELGYVGTFADQDLTLDAKLFAERIRSLVASYEENGNTPFYLTNDGWLDLHGLEIDLDWRPNSVSRVKFGYSLQKGKGYALNEINSGVRSYKPIGNRMPEQSFSLMGSYHFANGLDLSAVYYYTDEMTWGGDGDRIDLARRLDIRLAKSLSIDSSTVRLELLLQNLTNDRHYDFYQKPAPTDSNIWDRRIYLKATVDW